MTKLHRVPRARELPGMTDRKIAALEALAADYVDLRDRRLTLGEEEAGLKARIMAEMRKQHKTIYVRHGVDIRIVHGEDDVKVKVSKKEPDDEDDDDEPEPPARDPAAPKPPRHEGERPREEPPQEEHPFGKDAS